MRKQIIAICLILAMFAVVQTAELATESLEAKLAGGAHLGDRFSNAGDWAPLKKGSGYKFDEGQYGHKCLSQLHCDGERKCSYWGWCQDKSYSGPQLP